VIPLMHTKDKVFYDILFRIKKRGELFDEELWMAVKEIVSAVAIKGDEALFYYTEKFDGISLTAQNVKVSHEERKRAAALLPSEAEEALRIAASRIRRFHEKQHLSSLELAEEEGILLAQRILPLKRVGIYAPGGRAVYPSTVLMAAIPAKIAGVEEVIMVTPCGKEGINPLIAAAADLAGVDEIYKIGGAQAIAALAYGTHSIPQVDKIVGPGNAYVTAAKKMVFGQVAIDMIAGPSEVLIIADKEAPPSYIAADLLAQAEHDTMASALLLTPYEEVAQAVAKEICRQIESLSRKEIIVQSLRDFGALVVTRDFAEAITIANDFAPEHLELMVRNPEEILSRVRNAGAIFLGYSTPETLGDYLAGCNHILPTGGTARFSSPLGVYDFLKRTSILKFSPQALGRYQQTVSQLAQLEGFDAHGKSTTVRL